MVENIKAPRGYILDLDGCVYVEDRPTKGAREFLKHLRDRKKKLAFLTNNSSMTTPVIVRNLAAMGMGAEEREIITPIAWAGEFIRERFGTSAVFHLGIPETKRYIETWGHRFTEVPRDECGVVLLSCDLSLSYERLDRAVNFLRAGAALVVTNGDPVRPGRNGELRMETGALLAALTSCVSKKPLIIGKPSPYLFDKALKEMDLPPEAVLMIGDTPSTDIAGGRAAGIQTALLDPLNKHTPESSGADFIFADLRAVLKYLSSL